MYKFGYFKSFCTNLVIRKVFVQIQMIFVRIFIWNWNKFFVQVHILILSEFKQNFYRIVTIFIRGSIYYLSNTTSGDTNDSLWKHYFKAYFTFMCVSFWSEFLYQSHQVHQTLWLADRILPLLFNKVSLNIPT